MPSLRNLTIQLQTLRGEEVAWVPVLMRELTVVTRLDVNDLTASDYRIILVTDHEKIVSLKTITLAMPVRQAVVAVVVPTDDH